MIHKVIILKNNGVYFGKLEVETIDLNYVNNYYEHLYNAINKHGQYIAINIIDKNIDSWIAFTIVNDLPLIIWLKNNYTRKNTVYY